MLNSSVPTSGSVCVIIPMYNAAASIGPALESLSLQTRRPDKVIVIDDGSSDEGPQIVTDYVAPFELILLQQTNQGPAAARNRGVFSATERFIAFLDADDQWHPEKLHKQLALYEQLTREGRQVGLIDCYQMSEFSDGTQQLEDRRKGGNHFADFMRENVINGTSGVLVLRDAIIALEGFDQTLRYAEDRLLWTRIAEQWEIHTVPEVLLRRSVNNGNITAQPRKYYPYKVQFIELYLARYGAHMSKQQRIDFVLANHADFLARADQQVQVLDDGRGAALVAEQSTDGG